MSNRILTATSFKMSMGDKAVRKPNELAVGNTVFVVFQGNSSPVTTTAVVSKVGRNWIYISNGYRFLRNADWPAEIDGGQYSSPGNVYPDEDTYSYEKARGKAYMQIKHNIGFVPPEGVALADIQQAAKLLGIKLQ